MISLAQLIFIDRVAFSGVCSYTGAARGDECGDVEQGEDGQGDGVRSKNCGVRSPDRSTQFPKRCGYGCAGTGRDADAFPFGGSEEEKGKILCPCLYWTRKWVRHLLSALSSVFFFLSRFGAEHAGNWE
jgi:hypothetical protein